MHPLHALSTVSTSISILIMEEESSVTQSLKFRYGILFILAVIQTWKRFKSQDIYDQINFNKIERDVTGQPVRENKCLWKKSAALLKLFVHESTIYRGITFI